MKTFHQAMKEKYGCKVYKLSLSMNVTCPNRDGTLGTRGCIFCPAGGSGEFAADRTLPVREQIGQAKKRIEKKIRNGKYIAYFQSFTNTYGEIPYLKKMFTEAMEPEEIVGLSIATRPDCMGPEVIQLLRELNRVKPVTVELGLQTIHEKTAAYIRRGYSLPVYDRAVRDCREAGMETVVHVILGLPGETAEDMKQTVAYVAASGANGIKLQLLHVLRGTDLEQEYYKGKVRIMTLEEYILLLKQLLPLLPEDMVVHRLTGDGPKRLLIAPLWTGDKKRVLNSIRAAL